MSGDIVKRLYTTLSVLQEPSKSLSTTLPSPTFSSFIQQTAWALKGTNSQKASFLFILSRGSVQLLEATLLALLTALLDGNVLHDVLPSLKQWPSNVESLGRLVSNSFLSLKRNQDSDTLTVTDVQSWLSTTPIAVRAIDLTLVLLFLLPFSSFSDLTNFFGSVDTSPEQLLIPLKTRHPILHEKFSSELLDHSALLLLNGALPYECRGYLYPLFSSRIHGESFSTLCRQILDRGPTLIVMRDKGGNIFGGFASDKWMCHPQFTGKCHTHATTSITTILSIGSSSCFLFSLFPTMGVYSPTGYNDNYMYMQQSAQTMPNGIVSIPVLGRHSYLKTFSLHREWEVSWSTLACGCLQTMARDTAKLVLSVAHLGVQCCHHLKSLKLICWRLGEWENQCLMKKMR